MKITPRQIVEGMLAFSAFSFTTYMFVELYRKKKATDAVNSLADHIHLDLDDPYLKEYVSKAVDQEIKKAATRAAEDIVNLQKSTIANAVSVEVKNQKDILADSVKSAISDRVGKLSIDDIKEEALEEAREMASDKLREDMDDILDNYKQGLDNMATIYTAISKKASKTACGSGVTFTDDGIYVF